MSLRSLGVLGGDALLASQIMFSMCLKPDTQSPSGGTTGRGAMVMMEGSLVPHQPGAALPNCPVSPPSHPSPSLVFSRAHKPQGQGDPSAEHRACLLLYHRHINRRL